MEKSTKIRDMEKLSEHLEVLMKNPHLSYLFFELTDACNLSCLHCGSSSCPQNNTFLPAGEIKKVLDAVAENYSAQRILICLSGGEPLLHPDFFEIAEYAKKKGFPCGITTNGTLIDETVAEKIVQSGICSVTFSLDGTEKTHDWFRNKTGAFKKAILGIENLHKAAEDKIRTQITTVVHRQNLHELEAIYELVCRLGVDSWRLANLDPIGRALQHKELLLDGSQIIELLSYIREKRYSSDAKINVTYGCSHYLTEEYERTVRKNYFICGSGIFVASILCNGDIYSCMDIERRPELVQGNIQTDDFVDVWENRFQAFRKDRTLENESCAQCEDRKYCRGDSNHTWDYEQKKPWICFKKLLKERGNSYG